MKEVLASRLETLRAEHKKGDQRLRELRAQQLDLEQTLLRIEGAITVIQELVDPEANAAPGKSDNRHSG